MGWGGGDEWQCETDAREPRGEMRGARWERGKKPRDKTCININGLT